MKQFLKSFKDQRIVTRAICLCRLQTTDAVTRTTRALRRLKVKGQQTTECEHTVQVSRLWSEVVVESWQDVMGVAVLGPSLFVVLSRTNLVSEYEASTGRLQQRHLVAGLDDPRDMAGSTAHGQLVICDRDPGTLYLVDVVQGEKLTLTVAR